MIVAETKAEKAVAVAKDVLKRLKYGKLNVKRRTGFFLVKRNFPKHGSLQEFADVAEANCKVCALGGMFLSYARVYNRVRCDEVYNDFYETTKKLKQVFSMRTLALIEGVFERKVIRAGHVLDAKDLKVALQLHGSIDVISPLYYDLGYPSYVSAKKQVKKYHDAIVKKKKQGMPKGKALMTEICRNIIRNNGEFVLPTV